MKALYFSHRARILGLAWCAVVVGGAPASAQAEEGPGPATSVRAFITNYDGTGISVVDPEAGQLIAHIETGHRPHGVTMAPDGRFVYVSNEGSGTLSIIDPATNTVVHTLEVGTEPNQLAVSADGRHAFVTLHGDDAVAVVDLAQRKVMKVVPVGRAPHIALRSPDGRKIYVTSEGDMKLVALDAQNWTVLSEVSLRAFPRVLAMTPDGKRAYQTIRWLNGALVVNTHDLMVVVDRIALGEPDFAPDGKDAHGLAITPDGQQLWLTTQTTNTVTVINTGDHSIIGTVPVGDNPNWVEFTPDGAMAVISNTGSNDVSVVDVGTRRVVATVSVGSSPKRLAVGAVVVEPRHTQNNGEGALVAVHTYDFDEVLVGGLPSAWSIRQTNPTTALAKWKVFSDHTAPSPPNVLALSKTENHGSTYNLAIAENTSYQDLELSVVVKAVSGREDQGGGPIWRCGDENNYYICRLNPLEENVRVYFVKDGRRKQLDTAKVEAQAGTWHTVRVTMVGNGIRCYVDGKKLLEITDDTFTDAGMVGLWTKADAATSFDDFRVGGLR